MSSPSISLNVLPVVETASFSPNKPSIFVRYSAIIYNATAKSVVFLVAGAVAYLFIPVLTPPLLTIAGTIAATRLVIKIGNTYNWRLIESAQIYLAHFRDQHKYIQIAALVVILVLAVFCWQAACVLAIPFGIYAGIVIGLDFFVGAQSVQKRKEEVAAPPSGDAIYLE